MSTSKAKQLITEAETPSSTPGGPPQPPARGNLRRAMPPGGASGFGGEPPGMLNSRERSALKDILLVELLQMAGGDEYYGGLVKAAISGTDPDPGQIKHLMDEFGKLPQAYFGEQHHALLNKLANSAEG